MASQGTLQIVFLITSKIVMTFIGIPLGWLRRRVSDLTRAISRARQEITRPVPIPRPVVIESEVAREQRHRDEATRRSNQGAREQARMRIQLLYDRHRAELQNVFPESQFAAYFTRFITESLDPPVYEERVRLVEQMIRERLEIRDAATAHKFTSIEEVMQHFQQQEDRLAAIVSDADVLDSLRTTLYAMRDTALQKLLM